MQTPSTVEPRIVKAPALFERILVPIDYSMTSHEALAVALELQRTYGSRVCVFRIGESSPSGAFLGGLGGRTPPEQTDAALHRFLDNVVPGAARRVEVRTALGAELAPGICEAATDWGATLVVLPRGEHTTVFRSVTEKVVRDIGIPILVVPAPAKD